ncbi:MAG: hypothetical protein K0Q49_2119 [Haloplasmataceae bacterium]|jgi:hypothetical protein|nr:hypothetical protein [Haloplasmataceae bacterium]
MLFLALCGIAFLMFMSVIVRLIVFNPFSTVKYAFKDIYAYIVLKGYNNAPNGTIIAFVGLFGKGKTLSAVQRVVALYNKYNNKKVWCPRRKKFVTQKIQIISNVSLSIPYEKFVSLEQLVLCAYNKQNIDDENDTLTVTYTLGDEFSVQLNSRSFKTNINPSFLNTLVTCRHYYMSIFYTAQRFAHVDKLLRDVTSYVIDCRKIWRFQVHYYYDAWSMENATNANMITPVRRTGFFVKDKNYNAYNTLAVVENLKKSFDENDMMSDEEILALRCNQASDMDAVDKPSKKYNKKIKKTQKGMFGL